MGVDEKLRGRPAEDEHIPYYRQYIDQVPEGDVGLAQRGRLRARG